MLAMTYSPTFAQAAGQKQSEPQGLKPACWWAIRGTAEAMPFPGPSPIKIKGSGQECPSYNVRFRGIPPLAKNAMGHPARSELPSFLFCEEISLIEPSGYAPGGVIVSSPAENPALCSASTSPGSAGHSSALSHARTNTAPAC
jgi:hypothetical protein